MTTTKASITSIAQNLQFSNRTHFYSLFEKQFHMTPKEYRTKMTK
ncbi:AraC family transcriptional regulator [Butyrivibrio sp. MB2005]